MEYIFFIFLILILTAFTIKKARKLSTVLFIIFMLFLLLIYPKESIGAAKEGINLWLYVVVPSLLPFFIINDILISLKVPENIAHFLSPFTGFIFNTSGYGGYVFIMSIFSGYPTGAKIVTRLINEKKISIKEGQQILTFASTSGPLFIIGAIGAGMLNSAMAGYILYISHILGAIINGFIFKYIFKNKNVTYNIKNVYFSKDTTKEGTVTSAIKSSLILCGLIGGYIILFSVIISLLDKIEYFSILSTLLKNIFFISKKTSYIISNLIKTSLEISNGCSIVSSLLIEYNSKIIFSSFLIAFSGLSIIGQVASIISGTFISIKKYIISKIFHGIFSSAICVLILNLYPQILPAFSLEIDPLNSYIPLIIEIQLIIILILNIFCIYKKSKKS